MKFSRLLIVFLALAVVSSLLLINCKSKTNSQSGNATEEVVASKLNELTQAEIDDGWVLLFDGKTTAGWRGVNLESFPETGWNIDDDALHCLKSGKGEAGGRGGDVIYDKIFSNFHLKLEWKIDTGGNSGIFYLGQEVEDQPIWKTAPEMQVLDNERHPDSFLGKEGNRKAGSLYDLIPAVPQNTKPVMQWNTVEVVVYNGTVVHMQNGETILEYHLWTDDWNELVAGSKFPGLNPDWANVASEGYIGVQDHGDAVWFRNIKIKEL